MEKLTESLFNASRGKQLLFVLLLGAVFFIPFIGNVHLFDWDEINFAEIAREMRVTGEYFKVQIDFQPFFEKPPLFPWLQNISYSIFGVNEFAARFPNAFFGILSLGLLYLIGNSLKGPKFALLWVLMYFGTFLPHFFFKSGIIDPVFNFFIFLSIWMLIKAINQNGKKKIMPFFLAGIVNGLGILAKGPVALLLIGLTTIVFWLVYKRNVALLKIKEILLFGLAVAFMAGFWFLPETLISGPAFIEEFVVYMIGLLSSDVAGHAQPFYYHFVVVFLGCFPISIFGLRNLIKTESGPMDFNRWMLCLFWVVLILFSIVKTKIVNYSSMTYFPLSYLAAVTVTEFIQVGKMQMKKFFLIMGVILSLPLILVPFVIQNKQMLMPLLEKDPFAQDTLSILELPLWTAGIGLFFLVGIIVSYVYYYHDKIRTGVLVYSLTCAVTLNWGLYSLVDPIEEAVQGPAIDYYSRFAGKDVYLHTVGFKSYGRIFYFEKRPEQSKYTERELIEIKNPDKPVYFVSKTGSNHDLVNRTDVELLEKRGGYYLYKKIDEEK